MKQAIHKTMLALVLLSAGTNAMAIGSVANAKIDKIRVDVNGKVMIFFDRQIGGTPPSCVQSSYARALAVDTTTPGGSAVLSMALAAQAQDLPVDAFGLGTCGVYGGNRVETWNHGFIK